MHTDTPRRATALPDSSETLRLQIGPEDIRIDAGSTSGLVPCPLSVVSIGDRILSHFNRYGAVILDCRRLKASRRRELLLSLRALLGDIIPNTSTAEGWFVVEDRGTESDERFLATGADAFPLHTDRAFTEQPPGVLALLCESKSSGGGESILASAEDLYHHLHETCGREALISLFEQVGAETLPPGTQVVVQWLVATPGGDAQATQGLEVVFSKP